MKHQKGFSLVELLCVLAILSVLAYISSAQFLSVSQNTQDRQTIQSNMQLLSDALLQGRQLAVVSGEVSFLCGGLDCNGEWSSGFLLYQGESDVIAYRSMAFTDSVSVSWQGFPASKQQIEFYANGLSGYQNGTFEFCLGNWQAGLVLNQSGRFYVTDLSQRTEESCL